MNTLDDLLRGRFSLVAKNFDGARGRSVSLGPMPRTIGK
jgi:hypothetical protein